MKLIEIALQVVQRLVRFHDVKKKQAMERREKRNTAKFHICQSGVRGTFSLCVLVDSIGRVVYVCMRHLLCTTYDYLHVEAMRAEAESNG